MHYADPIQLDDIAAFAHVSKNNCMQIFKNGIRQSPISYLIQYRLNKAAKLLAATEMKVATISEKAACCNAVIKVGRVKICRAIDKENRVLTLRSAHGFSFGFLQPLLEFH